METTLSSKLFGQQQAHVHSFQPARSRGRGRGRALAHVLAKAGARDVKPLAAVSLRTQPSAAEETQSSVHQHFALQQPAAQPALAPADAAAADTVAAAAGAAAAAEASPLQPLLRLKDSWWPKLALLGSTMMWASYGPAVRLLYSSPDPPDSAVVLAVRGVLQACALLAVSLALQQPDKQQQQQGEKPVEVLAEEISSSSSSSNSGEPAVLPGGVAHLFRRWVSLDSPPLWMAAVELGLWNFTATMLQTVSLQLISATRASFLVQVTLLLTPLLSAASGYRPSRNVWVGCAVALAGCMLITADEAAADVAAGSWDSVGLSLGGDTAILSAALFYSLGVVRTAGYARNLPVVKLATAKSVVVGSLGIASLAVAAAGLAEGQPVTALWGGYAEPVAWAALLWAGLGPGAVSSFLHIQGQKHVPPPQAQLIFSSKPIWAAGLAWFLLGGEQLGPLTWAGGATLILASFIASAGGDTAQQQQAAGSK